MSSARKKTMLGRDLTDDLDSCEKVETTSNKLPVRNDISIATLIGRFIEHHRSISVGRKKPRMKQRLSRITKSMFHRGQPVVHFWMTHRVCLLPIRFQTL